MTGSIVPLLRLPCKSKI